MRLKNTLPNLIICLFFFGHNANNAFTQGTEMIIPGGLPAGVGNEFTTLIGNPVAGTVPFSRALAVYENSLFEPQAMLDVNVDFFHTPFPHDLISRQEIFRTTVQPGFASYWRMFNGPTEVGNLHHEAGDNNFQIEASEASMLFRTDNGAGISEERMRITAVDGYVGIHTAAPLCALDVNGRAAVRDLPVDNTLTRIVVADAAGKLFVKTLAPPAPADEDWLEKGSGDTPDDISNNIYTEGHVSIGTDGYENAQLYVESTTQHKGLFVNATSTTDQGIAEGGSIYSTTPSRFNRGIGALAEGGLEFNIGIFSNGRNAGAAGCTNIGVWGFTQNPSPPYSVASSNMGGRFQGYGDGLVNYGVRACASGASIQNWAGWFCGDVYVGGALTVILPFASETENTTDLENATPGLMKLTPRHYEYKTDKNKARVLPNSRQTGFIAENVEEAFPGLVEDVLNIADYDEEGNKISEEFESKGLNYTSLIPVLVKGFQEQQKTIDEQIVALELLRTQLQALQKQLVLKNTILNITTTDISLSDEQVISLEQNKPNPFSLHTSISYTIPENIREAQIMIYNMSGKLIKQQSLPIGKGVITIYAEGLEGNTFSYSLIADGKIIDTKKMMVAK